MRWGLLTFVLLGCQGEQVTSAKSEPPTPGTLLVGSDLKQPDVWEGLPAGSSQAYEFVAAASGTAHVVTFFVDASNTCPKIVIGAYTDRAGHPDKLLTSGTITAPSPGWNSARVADLAVSKGTPYWIALLCPYSSTGVLKFPDSAAGPFSTEFHASTSLEELPSMWSPGAKKTPDGPVSAYLSQ